MITYYENREVPFDSYLTKDLTFMLHLHKQLELVYVTEGSVSLKVDEHNKTLSQGELAIIFPNSIHSYESGQPSELLLVILEPELVGDYAQILNKNQAVNPFLLKSQIHPDIIYLLPYLIRYRQQPISRKLLKGYLAILVGRVLEQVELISSSSKTDADLVHRALYYINRHFTEPLTLQSISSTLGFSKYYLSRCFCEKTGCNFNQYLNSLRIDYAKRLLESSNLSVTEIAYESGFESQCTFYRAFRETSGATPNQYRKQFQKQEGF